MTAFLSARGRFFASLSASSHSLITWAQQGQPLILHSPLLFVEIGYFTHIWAAEGKYPLLLVCGNNPFRLRMFAFLFF